MLKIINIIEKDKADELMSLGYKYSTAKVDDKTIYQFVESPELLSYLNGKFSKQDFFISKYMKF